MLAYGWIVDIFNVLVRIKIRTRPLPLPLPNIVRIANHIDIYGRSLKIYLILILGDPSDSDQFLS